MNIVFWILQAILAVVFALHGWVYLTSSAVQMEERHAKLHPGSKPTGIPPAFNKFIGICEILGAVGLILPGLTGILTWLTPLAAAGLAVVMLGAAGMHFAKREHSSGILTVALVAISVVVAYGRWLTLPL